MATISKLDYLKKYMDGGIASDKPKKKKRKVKSVKNNIKIVDEQISLSEMKLLGDEVHEEFDLMEEKPLMYAADGATMFTKQYEEQQKKKANSWAPVQSVNADKNSNASQSDSDLSPDCTSKKMQITRNRNDSDVDVSPPRMRRQRHDSDKSDMSPPRQRKTRHDSAGSSDLSPQRERGENSDLSPARGRSKGSDSDVSPQRETNSRSKNRREEKPEVVSTGRKAGLQSGAELQKELELKRKAEKQRFDNMESSVSGKGAETVVRDRKSGKKIDLKLEELKKRREEEEKLQDAEKYAVWGRGVVQEKEYQQKLDDALQEMQKPLARYKGDKDLENMLKEQDRDGDPMLAYLSKKKTKQTEKRVSKPKYKGPTPPPNRFNIWPGYRFDGVDRSNGFEKQRFLEINKKKSFNEAKYKWSVEDM